MTQIHPRALVSSLHVSNISRVAFPKASCTQWLGHTQGAGRAEDDLGFCWWGGKVLDLPPALSDLGEVSASGLPWTPLGVGGIAKTFHLCEGRTPGC